MYNHKKQKRLKPTTKITNFRFWNNNVEYICVVVSPIAIPKYRLKEIFDRNFIGKKDINDLKYIEDFKKLDTDITYEIKAVKELGNVR